MAPSYDALRVRLIQVRVRPDILVEERETFIQRCRLRPDQLVVTNVLTDPLHTGLLDGVDAVLIGGAGAYSVTHDYPWTPALVDLLQEIDDREVPLFGSCWGHQFIARAYGGSVIHDRQRAEMGCGWVELTEAGRRDTLFSGFPPSFRANMGHQDRVSALPGEAVELARNDTAPHQAFRILGKPIYGTQFHSELDAASERGRLLAYRDYYPDIHDEADFQRVLDSLAETTEVDQLLRTFLERFCVDGKGERTTDPQTHRPGRGM